MNIQRIFVALASLAGCVFVFMPFAKPIIIKSFNLFDVNQIVGCVVLAAYTLTFVAAVFFGNKKNVLFGFPKIFVKAVGTLPAFAMIAVFVFYKQMKFADRFSKLDYAFYAIFGVSMLILLLCVFWHQKNVVIKDVVNHSVETQSSENISIEVATANDHSEEKVESPDLLNDSTKNNPHGY